MAASIAFLVLWTAQIVRAQGVWEYDPYRVTIWVSIDPSIPMTDQVRQDLYRQIDQQLDLVFGPTWIQQSTEAPGLLRVRMQRNLESIEYDDLMAGEMVIVVRKDHPDAKTIRTLDAVLEKIDQVAMVDSVQQQVLGELKRFEAVETWKKLAAKLQGKAKTLEELLQGVADGTHTAAMIPQVDAEGLKEYARPVFVRLPWQVDSLVRSMDKILMVVVQRKADLLECQIREFDCPMRKFGPRITLECSQWESLPRLIGYGASEAFCPVARIEQSDAKSVEMRVRAAGLIVAQEHPAKIYLGDVLIPDTHAAAGGSLDLHRRDRGRCNPAARCDLFRDSRSPPGKAEQTNAACGVACEADARSNAVGAEAAGRVAVAGGGAGGLPAISWGHQPRHAG
jgi:hypothetical protein